MDNHRVDAGGLHPAEADNRLGGRVRDDRLEGASIQAAVGSDRCLDSTHYQPAAQAEAKEHMARDYRTLRKGHHILPQLSVIGHAASIVLLTGVISVLLAILSL